VPDSSGIKTNRAVVTISAHLFKGARLPSCSSTVSPFFGASMLFTRLKIDGGRTVKLDPPKPHISTTVMP
jgi:hypothetical protein